MHFINTDFLKSEEIILVLTSIIEGNPSKDWVPVYHFDICDVESNKLGGCDLRIGYNDKLYYGGHIGYDIDSKYRGHHYAAKACKLLFSLAKKHDMNYLYITCNPDNMPSRKTCEYLNGELFEIVELPIDNDMRIDDGETKKCIFRFEL